MSSCLGLYWEAIESNDVCYRQCGSKDECLTKFINSTLVAYQKELGDVATPEALARVSGIKLEAIQIALATQRERSEVIASVTPSRSPVVDVSNVDQSHEEEVNEDQPRKVPPRKRLQESDEVDKPKKRRKRRKRGVEAGEAGEVVEVEDLEDIKKKPWKQPRKRRRKTEGPVNPLKAGSALPVVDPVSHQTGESVPPVEVQVEIRNPSKRWNPKFDLERFKRERRRNPLIRQLPPGYVIEREFPKESGQWHRVVVMRDHYQYNQKKFPTLYSVVRAIAGTRACPKQTRKDGTRPKGTREMVISSATKFFRLAKLILTLMEEREGLGEDLLFKKIRKRKKR